MAWYVLLPRIAQLGPWGVWAVLPFELLHGVTFAIQWSAITTHAGRVAPDGFHASAHQLINTIYFGLARGFGAAVGGRIFDARGGQFMFAIGALQSLVTLALCGVGRSLFGREMLGRGVPAPASEH